MDIGVWWAFFAAAWAISFSIGPGAVAAMGAGLNHGFLRGYTLTIGLILGFLAQLVVVSVGLGALIVTSSVAFAVVKWAGVAYLLWLGIAQWRSKGMPTDGGSDGASGGPDAVPGGRAAPVRRRSLVLRGFVINALNPKGTVFMLAVVPQFLDPARALLPQYAVIGGTLVFTDVVVMAIYTALAARVLGALRSPLQVRWLNRLFGSLLIGMAALLATFKRAA